VVQILGSTILDAIVADYFEMLEAELSGRRYVKDQAQRGFDGADGTDSPVRRV
jgi:hypothetical protein